jgi:hypothetical protein
MRRYLPCNGAPSVSVVALYLTIFPVLAARRTKPPSASPFDHARQELRVGKKHLIADSNFLDWFAFAAHVRASIMDLMNYELISLW